MTKAALSVFLMLVAASAALGANPSLSARYEGEISFDSASGATTIDATLGVEASWDAFTSGVALTTDKTGPKVLDIEMAGTFDDFALGTEATFDVLPASFTTAGLSVDCPVGDLDATLVAMLEGGLGLGLTLHGQGLVHTFDLGLNLDAHGRVQSDGCALPFTFAKAEATIPLCDCAEVDAELLVENSGFSELLLSASRIGGLPFGVQFAATLVYVPAAKTLELTPSFSLEADECVDLYAGLEWDATSHSISGIEVYGVGLRCDVCDVAVRGLWALDSAKIALVPPPYWALVGIVFDLALPCDRIGEASAAILFENTGASLFGIGEFVAEATLSLADSSTLTLSAELPVNGGAVFSVSWKIAF
jgi:hypothetical protein